MRMQTDKKTGALALIKELVILLLIVFVVRTIGFGLYQVPTGSMETTILVGERFFAEKFTPWFSKPARGDIIAFNQPETMYVYSSNPAILFVQQYIWGPVNLTKRVIGLPGDKVKGVIEDGKPVIYINDVKLDEPYVNKYPLISVYKESLQEVDKLSEAYLTELLLTGRIRSSDVNELKGRVKEQFATQKSFDPAVSWDKQPFYRIQEDRIALNGEGEPVIRYPYTVLMPDQRPIQRGNGNYWGNSADEFYIELGPNQYWCMGDNRLGSGDSRYFGPVDGKHIHGRILYRIWSMDSDESWWILDLLKHPIDFWTRIRWNRFFERVR
ncbi:MAG: signal peptidase I [Candidatus Dependentiae bacterium]|nr:signal peptidase I [Candidatus Dependentiae bacterium]